MRTRGFTLIEMVVSLAIVAVIGAALTSTLHLAARAVPNPAAPPEIEVGARAVSIEFCNDLALAKSITVINANAIEFTVPDQTSDGNPETIRWEWEGDAKDPLVRTYNGVATNRIAKVDDFTLQWFTKTAAEQTGTTNLEGAEQLLVGFTDRSSTTAGLGTTKQAGIGFTPVLPSDAVSFSVTRYTARVTFNSPTSLPYTLRLEAADGTPGSVLASGTLSVTTPANSNTNQSANVAGVAGLAPGTGLWLVFAPTVLLGSASMPYQSAVANGNTKVCYSTSSGLTWTVVNDGSALFAMYGKVVRPQPVLTNLTRVQSVRVSLKPSGTNVRSVVAGTSLAARPLMPGQATPTTAAPVVSLPVGVTITA
ncbi:MAG: prepilin-type N-terminal cleavage/methylation domain-containing protein, partial [Phycisphaerales bacterium]